ncbi:uncharacterized protein [Bemisia tabaci]|uniref:uncharacterized protein isoform X1 n=1 Tax=Bemisia tabaci TaxID=7038 RepID=UPI003B2805BD
MRIDPRVASTGEPVISLKLPGVTFYQGLYTKFWRRSPTLLGKSFKVLVCACLTFVAGLELGKMKLSRRDSNAGADNPSTCPDEDFDVATLTCRGAAPAPDRQVLTPTDPSPHHKNKDHHGKKKKNSR